MHPLPSCYTEEEAEAQRAGWRLLGHTVSQDTGAGAQVSWCLGPCCARSSPTFPSGRCPC